MATSFPPAERMSRKDFAVVGAIVAATAVVIGGTYASSDARKVDHTVASAPLSAASVGEVADGQVPATLKEAWEADNSASKLSIDDGGVLIQNSDRSITVKSIATGEDAWSYTAANEICGTAMDWEETLVITRSPKGCGEVIGLTTTDGQYYNTRSALASDNVTVQQSNDNVGTVSADRVELWRNDLVRTVEVGTVEAPAQPNQQVNPQCNIASSLWRKEFMAVVQSCADENKSIIRVMKTVPEESTKPEDYGGWNVALGTQLVAIGQDRAAAYVPDGKGGASLEVFNQDGKTVESYPIDASELLAQPQDGYSPITADLPHNMTWFDGQRLVAFDPATLKPMWTVDGALGTGAAMGGRALVPVKDGLAVVNWESGQIERTIPVDRGGYDGPVTAKVAGRFVIEQRGDKTVVLAS